MKIVKSNLTIEEQIDLENAKAMKEAIETQNLVIQYVALMSDIEIFNDEEGANNVSNFEKIEE